MKRRTWLIAIGFSVIAIAIIWWRSGSLSRTTRSLKPTLSVTALSVKNINKSTIDMKAKMHISNPLPVQLSSQQVSYSLYINGNEVMENEYDHAIKVAARDTAVVDMPMTLIIEPLVKILNRFTEQNTDSADYTLKATFALDVPIAGKRTVDLQFSERLPAFKLLKIKPSAMDIDKFTLKKSTLTLRVTVENPNLFPIKMKNAKYNITLDDKHALEGTINGITNIPAKSTIEIPVDLEVQTGTLTRMVWKSLFDKDKTPFTIDFTCRMVSKNEIFNNSLMAMQTKGTLADLKDVSKTIKKASERK